MLLERLKQNSAIRRQFGVHGRIKLVFKDKKEAYIYTLESPWDYNEDEPNGIVGLSCIKEGVYQLSIEDSPVHKLKLPFLINPKTGVQLRQKSEATDRTGHAFCHIIDGDIYSIYGRYILIGADVRYNNQGFYEPIDGYKAYNLLMKYLEESGDREVKITWIN